MEERINKLSFIKIKNLCPVKNNVKGIRSLSAYLRVWVPYKKHGGTKKGQAMWSEMKAECREIHSSHSQVQQPDPDSLRQRIEKYI